MFCGVEKRGPIAIEIEAMKRRSVPPEQGFRPRIESKVHGPPRHRFRQITLESKPRRTPHRPPSPTGLHPGELIIRERTDLVVRRAAFKLGDRDLERGHDRRRDGSKHLVGEGFKSKSGVFKIGKHGVHLEELAIPQKVPAVIPSHRPMLRFDRGSTANGSRVPGRLELPVRTRPPALNLRNPSDRNTPRRDPTIWDSGLQKRVERTRCTPRGLVRYKFSQPSVDAVAYT